MLKKLMRDYALMFVGLPYKWGGNDSIQGYDCSGFVLEILHSFGKGPKYDTTAQGLYDYYKTIGDLKNEVNLGDLVFYGKNTKIISHIAFGIANNMIIESSGGNALTTSLEVAANQNAFIKIRPYDYRSDLISIIDPIF